MILVDKLALAFVAVVMLADWVHLGHLHAVLHMHIVALYLRDS